MGFPGGAGGNEAACNAGDVSHGFDPWEDRHGNPLQYSCPENLMDRGAWQGTVHRVAKKWTQLQQLSTTHTCACTHTHNIYIYIYIYIFLFHYDLPHDIEYSSLCYTVGPCCLAIQSLLGF